MELKVLVADDDDILRELVCDIVRKAGYVAIEACHGKEALDVFFGTDAVHLVILDVMMPFYDGWEVLKEIRQHSEVPVIMLTALGDEGHEVVGLKTGANDYVAKPFSYEVLVARIHAALRSTVRALGEEQCAGDLSVNPQNRRVKVMGREIELNRKELSLLLFLMKNRNLVLTREQILSSLWGYSFEGDVRTIDTHVKMLRAKLHPCGHYIHTVRGYGYKFEVTAHEND